MLHTVCGQLLDNIKLIHDKNSMMNLFDDIAKEIPKFKEFVRFEFETKKTKFIASSQTKSIPYSTLPFMRYSLPRIIITKISLQF